MALGVGLLAQTAGAVVVSDTNIWLGNGPPSMADYTLGVYQDEAATNDTGILINVSGETLSFVNTTIDDGSDWYLTSFGNEFMASTIESGAFPFLVRSISTGWETHDLAVGFGDFYLGVNTGVLVGPRPDPDFSPRELFGWVHLQNSGGTLTMLGNAMSYGEPGLVIGTTQVVPEPGIFGLALAGLVLAGLRRCRSDATRRGQS